MAGDLLHELGVLARGLLIGGEHEGGCIGSPGLPEVGEALVASGDDVRDPVATRVKGGAPGGLLKALGLVS